MNRNCIGKYSLNRISTFYIIIDFHEKIESKTEEKKEMLRHINEEMSRKIETLYKNRFDMVQELASSASSNVA